MVFKVMVPQHIDVPKPHYLIKTISTTAPYTTTVPQSMPNLDTVMGQCPQMILGLCDATWRWVCTLIS